MAGLVCLVEDLLKTDFQNGNNVIIMEKIIIQITKTETLNNKRTSIQKRPLYAKFVKNITILLMFAEIDMNTNILKKK